jgi:hypothetical protein
MHICSNVIKIKLLFIVKFELLFCDSCRHLVVFQLHLVAFIYRIIKYTWNKCTPYMHLLLKLMPASWSSRELSTKPPATAPSIIYFNSIICNLPLETSCASSKTKKLSVASFASDRIY